MNSLSRVWAATLGLSVAAVSSSEEASRIVEPSGFVRSLGSGEIDFALGSDEMRMDRMRPAEAEPSLSGPFDGTADEMGTEYDRPQIAVGPDRDLYLTYRVHPPDSDRRLILAFSGDGGFRWRRATIIDDSGAFSSTDPVVYRNSTSGGVVWTRRLSGVDVRLLHARLNAETLRLDSAVRMDDGDIREVRYNTNAVVHLGRAVLCLWEQETPGDSGTPGAMALRSFDGGSTWNAPREVIDSTMVQVPWAGPFAAPSPDGHFYVSLFTEARELLVYRSVPASREWERRGTPADSTVTLFGGFSASSIAADVHGVIKVAFEAEADPDDTGRTRVYLSTSEDGGLTWTRPDPVSDLTGLLARNHGEPKLVADGLGAFHLAWISNIPFRSPMDAYYTRLDPGATHWLAPVRINPDSCTVEPQAPRSLALAADVDGHAYIAWGHAPDFESEAVYVATTRSRPFDPLEGVVFTHLPVAPNPARGPATLRIPSEGDARVRVRLYDGAGRLVRRWEAFRVVRGVRGFTWDGRDARGAEAPSGVYFWEVDVDGDERRKLRARSVRVR